MIITRDTDVAALVGRRVRIARTIHDGRRETRYHYEGVFDCLWHEESCGGVGGMLRQTCPTEEHTGFTLPYGNAEVEVL